MTALNSACLPYDFPKDPRMKLAR